MATLKNEKLYIGTEIPVSVDDSWQNMYEMSLSVDLEKDFKDGEVFYIVYPESWTLELNNNEGHTIAPNYLLQSVRNSIPGYNIAKYTAAISANSFTSTWQMKFIK